MATTEAYDEDFEGDFEQWAAGSTGTAPISLSSRVSVLSDSVAGDEDWNLVVNDEQSTLLAIKSANEAGIPLPRDVPASALLGGSIKRLGKKQSKQKVHEDWGNDLEMSDQPLQLKSRMQYDAAVFGEDLDDLDDLEGSLGIRFVGTKSDFNRNDTRSTSLMSLSLDSAAAESETDELGGLEIPDGIMDFEAILKKRRAADAELSDLSQQSSTIVLEPTTVVKTHKKSKMVCDEQDDFMRDFDFGSSSVLDVRKRTTNKNVQIKSSKPAPASAAHRPATTLNFHDKPTDKPMFSRSHIPRLASGQKSTSRLEPVFESGHRHAVRERRQPTTTGAQLLRSKRSAPALRNKPSAGMLHKSPFSYLSAGPPLYPAQNINAHNRSMPYHLRRDSDTNRHGTQSPPLRPSSRLAHQTTPDTPSRESRQRHDIAPPSLVREAAAKRTLTKPAKKRNFGDGSELEIFDDLPTSVSKESKFVKQPTARGPPKQGIRRAQSRNELQDPIKRNSAYSAYPERMPTPAPSKPPSSPVRGYHEAHTSTPSYLRDTAASRIARESRLGSQARPRSAGPLQPLISNWKAQVAARSPHTSPNAHRQSRKRPGLIAGIGSQVPKSEKGMTYNPQTLRWEGNENTLDQFDLQPLETPTPTGREQTTYMHGQHGASESPTRPALIAHVPTSSGHQVQVQNGMVYDPHQMKWLKVKGGRDVSGQLSPSATEVDEEEDAFAGIEDLKDEMAPAFGAQSNSGLASPISVAAQGVGEVHEEFDLGPRFIRNQQDEEAAWRRRCDAWFVQGAPRPDDGGWRRSAIRDIIRDIAPRGEPGSF